MPFDGIYQGESWRDESEKMERKRIFAERIFMILDADTELEKAEYKSFLTIRAEGTNSDGEKMLLLFHVSHELHKNIYSVQIRNEATKTIYRLDKTLHEEDSDEIYRKLAQAADTESLDDVMKETFQGILQDNYKKEEDGTLVEFNDNWAETNISSRQALEQLDDFGMTKRDVIAE